MPGEDVGEVILVTGGYDHAVKLWNANSGVTTQSYDHPNTVSFYVLILTFCTCPD